MGQKATKRKSKGEKEGTSTNTVDRVEEAMRKKKCFNTKLSALREKELENEYYDLLMKDTSAMLETQLKDYEAFCKIIRNKQGI